MPDYIFNQNVLWLSGTSRAPLPLWISSPYMIGTVTNRSLHCRRWYILVVEPSPTFRYRSSAADYPLFHLCCFLTLTDYFCMEWSVTIPSRRFTSTFSGCVVGSRALGSSSNSPDFHLKVTP